METAKRLGLLATAMVTVAIVATTLGMQTAAFHDMESWPRMLCLAVRRMVLD
jgi:hypothetical protein